MVEGAGKEAEKVGTLLCPAGDKGQGVQAKPEMLGDFILEERWENFEVKARFPTYEIEISTVIENQKQEKVRRV